VRVSRNTTAAVRIATVDRSEPREIEEWARDHDLPYFDEPHPLSRFPHRVRARGADRHEDIQVLTDNYRGSHAASRATSGLHLLWRGGRKGGALRSARGGGLRMKSSGRPRDCATASPGQSRSVMASGFTLRQAAVPGARAGALGRLHGRQYLRVRPHRPRPEHPRLSGASSSAGYCPAITPGALRRGRMFHVQYKPFYEAIGEPNNRNRKPSVTWAVRRAAHAPGCRPCATRSTPGFGTERDKVNYFADIAEQRPAEARGIPTSRSARAKRRPRGSFPTSSPSVPLAMGHADTCSSTW
jgi:hypothetical protein